ncbi:hypothetical protein ACIBCU_26320 [Streptomyces sp. NPDC051064]|uniref:hypothetical protein n=1 Tax=Streptomyces sp. NPDC051064 TaxID=3365641 RepID=UPI0037A8A326
MATESVAMHPIEWMRTDKSLDAHLGKMVRQASTLEYFLEQTAKALSGSPYGALLISGESISRVIEACKALVLAREDASAEWQARFKDTLIASKNAFERRNQYVHGSVSWRGPDGIPGTSRSRRLKPEATFIPLDLDDLASLTREFERLTFQAAACLSAALDEFPDHLAEDYSDD